MKNVTLQINVAPFDYRHVIHLLDHHINVFNDTEVNEILLVYDENKKHKKIPADWFDYNEKLKSFMNMRKQKHPMIQIISVDMKDQSRKDIEDFFFCKGKLKLYDFRGAAFFSYLFGLYHAKNDYIIHLDSDMFLGGGSKTWLSEAQEILEQDKQVLMVSPLPGPPHPEQLLIHQRYEKYKNGNYSYRFTTMSTRIFMIDKQRFAKVLKSFWPNIARIAWAIVKRFPINDGLEDTVSKVMKQKGLIRVDFLGKSPGLWSLHPIRRSEIFYNSIPQMIERMYRMEMPKNQFGYYNFTDSFIDWSDAEKPYK
jgi:hypothetical protein